MISVSNVFQKANTSRNNTGLKLVAKYRPSRGPPKKKHDYRSQENNREENALMSKEKYFAQSRLMI